MTRTVSLLGILTGFCAVGMTGCAGNQQTSKAVQFEPRPVARVGTQELNPVGSRSMTELLREANTAFDAANLAQQRGDHEASLGHYTHMLELLTEAQLDPEMFYELRSDFGRLLDSEEQESELLARIPKLDPARPERGVRRTSALNIPHPLPERVLTEIEEIKQLYPRNFQGGLNRSSEYLPYIRSEFRKAGLPDDLVWLAMVESQFTPKIVSRAGAGGMWQFMPATGRRYGLRIDSYVDERYNWQKATKAAIAYLTDLYHMFDGNWALAVSAYNMGEAGMERAIAANGGDKNLWRLIEKPPASNRMQTETKKFYPKLIASVIVASDPERFGFTRDRRVVATADSITVNGAYALADLERAAGYPEGTLKALNPHFLRGTTPPDGEYQVLVPAGARMQVASAVAIAPKSRALTHTVKRGETLSEIAGQYHVAVNDLQRANKIRSGRSLQVGQRLSIPGATGVGGGDDPAIEVASASGNSRATYRVKRGDSLSGIAKKNGVAVAELQRWNDMGRSTQIHAGDTLYMASNSANVTGTNSNVLVDIPSESPSSHDADLVVHTVQAGEFPARIAAIYGVDLEALLSWNRLSPTATIHPGDELKVYGGNPKGSSEATMVMAKAEPKKIHRVEAGESASLIASKYGVSTRDFLAWNHLSEDSVLRVGEEYVVHAPSTSRTSNVPSTPKAKKVVHTVAKGQNPTTIARRYGVSVTDLFSWNGWNQTPVLHVGDNVVIFR